MSLNWFLMTEWSKLLHQLNSISPSLKDPVKLAHISGYHHPFPTRAAHEPKAAQPAGDRWQHPCLSSAPAASRLWRRLIGNTLVYTVDRERLRRRGQRQRHNQTEEDGNYCDARSFGTETTVAFMTKTWYWIKDICDSHHKVWIYCLSHFS